MTFTVQTHIEMSPLNTSIFHCILNQPYWLRVDRLPPCRVNFDLLHFTHGTWWPSHKLHMSGKQGKDQLKCSLCPSANKDLSFIPTFRLGLRSPLCPCWSIHRKRGGGLGKRSKLGPKLIKRKSPDLVMGFLIPNPPYAQNNQMSCSI